MIGVPQATTNPRSKPLAFSPNKTIHPSRGLLTAGSQT
ncbi:hypothetical protein RA11412_0457 [Rothia aeria]|uniref:Uncharacterized protein n=1 Tax=Rothia aeria TaxID=172042 RepID=A0A2Z5QWI4_9MICC|nr:hypothetical protein RA11412_0457 [Rothia aeria]